MSQEMPIMDIKSGDIIGLGDLSLSPVQDHSFTIGAMARDFNVSLRALRFYEDRGLLHPLRRGSSRLYSAADRLHLEMILRGKQLGFTLTEIHDIIHSQKEVTNAEGLELALQPEQIAAQITHLERQREGINDAINALRSAHQKMNSTANFAGAQS